MVDTLQQHDELITRRKLAQLNNRPVQIAESPKPATSSVSKSAQFLDRLYSTATSLPVTSAILALLISQGVGLNGAFWYLNYAALSLIMLTCFALLISQLSAPASHSFCETVFLLFYTPLTMVFDSLVNVRDVEERESQKKRNMKQLPFWFIQGLHASVIVADSMGLSLTSILYVICTSVSYYYLHKHFDKYSKGEECSYYALEIIVSPLVLIADFVYSPSNGLCNVAFFMFSSPVLRKLLQTLVDGKNFESLEGLDKHYVNGFMSIAQAFYSTVMLYQHFHISLLILPVMYFLVYLPTQELKLAVQLIHAESLCLSNFRLATKAELSSYDDVCAVCLTAMSHARVTPCKHIFHGKCLKNCLKKKALCPMCNTEVL